jgi:GTPase SAR1 family protein
MAELENNRLTFKLVYYGPAQSGKTTNLMRLHDRLLARAQGRDDDHGNEGRPDPVLRFAAARIPCCLPAC